MRRTNRSHSTRRLTVALLVTVAVLGSQPAASAGAEAPTGGTSPSKAQLTATAGQVDVQQERAVRYGPYTIQPGPETPDGRHGHAHSGNQFAFGVEKPCSNCYITGMVARLSDENGVTAGASTNVFLHHMLLFNTDAGRADATCSPGFPFPLGLFGQRFFASGDERTPIRFPDGYGYRVGTGGWNLIWDLMSISAEPETVYFEVTFTWVPATTPGITDVEPVWFDVDQCGDSQIDIPVGPSQQSWTWTVNRPGDMVGVGGHVHDNGINLTVDNLTTGERICDSVAGYGETPLYIDHHGEAHISSMSTCGGPGQPPITRLSSGEQVRITSHYDSPVATNDAMGIAIAYMAPPAGDCVRATNQEHVTAGRATSFIFWAFAVGSGTFLGGTGDTTSLREGPVGSWTMVPSC